MRWPPQAATTQIVPRFQLACLAKTALSAPMLRGAQGYACAYIIAQETLRLALSHIVGWEDTGGTPRWRCYMQMLLHVLVLPLCVAS